MRKKGGRREGGEKARGVLAMHRIDDRFPSTEADPWNRLMREVKYEIERDEMAGSYYVYILGSIKGTMILV